MKNERFPLVAVLGLAAFFIAFLRAQETLPVPPVAKTSEELSIQAQGVRAVYLPETVAAERKVKSDSIFIVDASPSAFVIQTYNRIFVGTWLEIRGKDAKGAMSITLTDQPVFAPTEVRIVVKNEPVVAKRNDGSWEISFKEIRP